MRPFLLSLVLLCAGAALAQSGTVQTGAHKVELAKVLAPVEAVDVKNRILVIKTLRAVTALAVARGVKGLERLKPSQMVELDFYASVGSVVTTRPGEPARTRYWPAASRSPAASRCAGSAR